MDKRLRQISNEKDSVMIPSRRRRSSSSKSLKKLEQIPVDLIFEIFSKLPLKSIARFHCVSRELNSILRSSEFTNMFLKVSSSCPRLLFTVQVNKERHFYSAPQPRNPDNNSSSLTIEYHMCFPLPPQYSSFLHGSVNGLLYTGDVQFEHGCKDSKVMIIFNPSSRQSIPLPIMKGPEMDHAITFLGYDPINKQYKVLCMSMRRNIVIKHEVLTLGIKKPAWRMIKYSLPPHYPYSPISINGVLYYLGNHGPDADENIVVCFDVRSEKFKSIQAKVKGYPMLINYKGKLGVHPHLGPLNGETKSVELLVLNDVEKKEWSQHIYVLPPFWKDLVADIEVYFVGVSGNGEFVFSTAYDPLYIFFYNVEKNTIARVKIQGIDICRSQYIWSFIDHVETVKLM